MSGRVVSAQGPAGADNVWTILVMTGDPAVVGNDEEFDRYRSEIKPGQFDLRLNGIPASLDHIDFCLLNIAAGDQSPATIGQGHYLSVTGSAGVYVDREPRERADYNGHEWIVIPQSGGLGLSDQ